MPDSLFELSRVYNLYIVTGHIQLVVQLLFILRCGWVGLIIERYCYSLSVKEQRNCERVRQDLSRGSWLLHFLNTFFPSNVLYIQRLAHLSEKQVQRDQRKVEDTAASNRPSEVEKDFTAFFDDDRMDACEKMQKLYGSEEESEVGISYPRLACMIFEVKYSKCFS